MEIEFFDPEKHKHFLDKYRKFSRAAEDEERQFFDKLLRDKVQKISEITEAPSDFKMYFAMTDETEISDEAPINFYVHGFSFPEWLERFERDVLMIRSVKERENWEACLTNMIAHEMAHQEYYRKNKTLPGSNLQSIIFEGHAMNRAEQVANELEIEWKPHYRSNEKLEINIEEVHSVLDETRTREAENIFENGEKPCEEAEGYNLAYQVVKDIVSKTDVDLGEIPEMDEKKAKKEVEKSIERLY